MEKRLSISILGAGGKMGCRIVDNLVKHDYELYFIEVGERGIANLKERNLATTDRNEALAKSDYVILALPDALLKSATEEITPYLREGSTVITLDPAAAYMSELTTKESCTYVVTHPCHPALFGEQETEQARKDLFGGIAAKQDIVIALMKGDEEKFLIAEQICINMFAPVTTCHRITVEQMAILEPAAAEVVVASAAVIMKEAIEEAISRGVPRAAAEAFLLGHIQIPLAITLKNVNPFSDAAKIAIEYGKKHIYREDWKKVFEPENVREVLGYMLHPERKL